MLPAPESEYLLLDEPTTFLDFKVQADLFELCQILKTAGKTIVLVLHDLTAAYHVSDKSIVLDRGTAAAQGTKETILDKGIFPEVFTSTVNPLCQDPVKFVFFSKKKRKQQQSIGEES